MTYWILAIIGMFIVAFAWQARMFIHAHNSSIERVVKVATEETEKLLQQAMTTDNALTLALKTYADESEKLSFHVKEFMKQSHADSRRDYTSAIPTKTEKKKLNIQDYIYSLEYAKDTFAISPVERKALDVIINRIKEKV